MNKPETILNEKSIKRLEKSEFGKAFPDIRKSLEFLAKQLKQIDGGFGHLALDFYELSDLKKGEFVPFIMVGVVSANSLLNGDRISLEWEATDD